MNLDLVLGLSCNNISSLACDQNSGIVAHAASGVLVFLNTKTNGQVKYLHVRKNCVSSASFSIDGRYVTTGETGYRPAVRVWRLKDGQEVATLYGHEFGIKFAEFSPSMTEIVSVGMEHDIVVNVWSWPDGIRVATNNIVDVIRAVAYSDCGTFFITAGCRHIKFWYPKLTITQSKQTGEIVPAVLPLYGRLGILGECKEQTFIDIACGNGASANHVFAITRAGGMVILSSVDRQLKGHKSIEGIKGTCIKVHDRLLFIGFNNGDIHMFNATTMAHVGALPAPTCLRRTGLKSGGVFSLTFNLTTFYLITTYKNSCMCVWDMQDAANVKQKYVAVYHGAAILNMDSYSSPDPQGGSGVWETLVTVSQDSTVRLWGIHIDKTVCCDRLSIFYSDDSSSSISSNIDGGGGAGGGNSQDGNSGHTGDGPRQKTLINSGCITTIKVSPDRNFIATGNKVGNVCVYDKETLGHRCTVKAHNREITALAFYFNMSAGHLALISGSRDRLIHIMDANNEFRLVSSLSLHSSSISALLVCHFHDMVRIVSASPDRLVAISEAQTDHLPFVSRSGNPNLTKQKSTAFQLAQAVTCVSSPTDIAIDHKTQEMAIGHQDGKIRVRSIAQAQEKRTFPGCLTSEAQIIKICLDNHGALLISATSDKTLNVINFLTGQILHTVTGHHKFVSGLIFTSDGDHAISTSMDGCVFLWRLGNDLKGKRLEIINGANVTAVPIASNDCAANGEVASISTKLNMGVNPCRATIGLGDAYDKGTPNGIKPKRLLSLDKRQNSSPSCCRPGCNGCVVGDKTGQEKAGRLGNSQRYRSMSPMKKATTKVSIPAPSDTRRQGRKIKEGFSSERPNEEESNPSRKVPASKAGLATHVRKTDRFGETGNPDEKSGGLGDTTVSVNSDNPYSYANPSSKQESVDDNASTLCGDSSEGRTALYVTEDTPPRCVKMEKVSALREGTQIVIIAPKPSHNAVGECLTPNLGSVTETFSEPPGNSRKNKQLFRSSVMHSSPPRAQRQMWRSLVNHYRTDGYSLMKCMRNQGNSL